MERAGLAVLEYPLIVQRLAEAAATPHGAELSGELLPSPDADEVAVRQARTAEAVELIEAGNSPSLNGIADIRASADRAERGGSLDPRELRAIATTIAVTLAARN